MGLDAKAENLRRMDSNPNRDLFRRMVDGGYTVITLGDLETALSGGKQLPTKGILYTHDAGVGVNEKGITE